MRFNAIILNMKALNIQIGDTVHYVITSLPKENSGQSKITWKYNGICHLENGLSIYENEITQINGKMFNCAV